MMILCHRSQSREEFQERRNNLSCQAEKSRDIGFSHSLSLSLYLSLLLPLHISFLYKFGNEQNGNIEYKKSELEEMR